MRSLPAWLAGLGILATTLCTVGGPARGGAWTRAEGEGQLILSSGRRTSPAGALVGGASERDLTLAQLYVEYGLLDDLTLGASAYVEIAPVDAEDGSAGAAFFARKRLWQDDRGNVVSVQGAVSLPFEKLISDSFARSKPDSVTEFQLRALYGKSWWGDWGNAFLSTEAGYHLRSEGAPDELRLDATAGFEPHRCCMALFSLYTAVPLGNRTGSDSRTSLKMAPSFAYTLWPEIARNAKKPSGRVFPSTIQIGLDYDVLNPGDGLGVFVSIWKRF